MSNKRRTAARGSDKYDEGDDLVDPQCTSVQDNTKPDGQLEVMMKMFMQMNAQTEELRQQHEQAREERFQQLLTTVFQAQSQASERQSELEQKRLDFEIEQSKVNAERRATEEALRKAHREREMKIHQTPKLPPMKDKTDVELYLEDFEVYMNELETPPKRGGLAACVHYCLRRQEHPWMASLQQRKLTTTL